MVNYFKSGEKVHQIYTKFLKVYSGGNDMILRQKIQAFRKYLKRLEAEQKRQDEISRAEFLEKAEKLRARLRQNRFVRYFL